MKSLRRHAASLTLSVFPFVLPACLSDGQDEDGGDGEELTHYTFESRFEAGTSSVSYSGQSFRQVLIASLTRELSEIQSEIADEGVVFEEGEIAARLLFYYYFDPDTSLDVPHLVSTDPAPLQATFGDISDGADLASKIAGNDAVGQHQDWSESFVGWDADSPEALVLQWIEEVDELGAAYSQGEIPLDPNGAQIPVFYVSGEGRDYQQLLQKFLLGAINFSQGTDDYLDDTEPGKGLLADNTVAADGKPYTELEHAWDEGFGYWGGARNYLDYTDDEIAGKDGRTEYASGYNDWDQDGMIDLKSEMNFSAAVNAAKRDRGSAESAPTDFSGATMAAFLEGRRIIAEADGELSDDEFNALLIQRDIVVTNWEKAIAATAVHYINDVIRDRNAAEYDFVSHAKHWSELKGFMLSLQFSPHSPVVDGLLANLLLDVGVGPTLPGAPDGDGRVAELIQVRDALGEAYGFDAANLGDEAGNNGW